MSKSGLGKAIQNKLERKQKAAMGNKAPIFYQETEQNDAEIKKQKMRSIIQQNSLSEFLQTAELSQQNFKANRDIKFREIKEQIKNKKVIMIDNKKVIIQDDIDQSRLKGLQLPRRPNWKQADKDQLNKLQAQSYLNWRRNLAKLQQSNNDIQITPYQKNIQVWKQLWRVTQRADLMVQIVDGRDPLFFRCQDLFDYVTQVNPNKKSLLLINKSDLVPEQVRARWNKYFKKHNLNHIFFSAKLASKVQQNANQNSSQQTVQTQIATEAELIQHHFNRPQIITVSQLILLLSEYGRIIKKDKIEVGLVGYPNVGKSSVINALMGQKKVAVASMPGKTKHFQTLILTDKVTLCDCPGLVFPRISASHAYMVLNGLYPIDTIKTYHEPIKILTQRVDRSKLQQAYAIHWKQNQFYNEDVLLNKYSQLKGFFTGNGLPNQSVAAKHILKDYINGVIVYARNPPQLQGQELVQQEQTKEQIKEQKKQASQDKLKQINTEQNLDSQFFKNQKVISLDIQDQIKDLTQQDLLDIIEGKKIVSFKITKQIRSNIKHALKRGQSLNQIKKKCFNANVKDNKKLVKF